MEYIFIVSLLKPHLYTRIEMQGKKSSSIEEGKRKAIITIENCLPFCIVNAISKKGRSKI